jgi:hypothetical protein
MNLELTDEETAALLRELDGLIDGDRYFLSPRIKNPEGDPRQDQAGAGARADCPRRRSNMRRRARDGSTGR